MSRLVPAYALYGEAAGDRFPDPLHVETIVARSAIHDWRIRPHRHADLWQIFVLASGGGEAQMDGSILALQPPLALLMPPMAVHGFTFEPGTVGHVVSIPADTLARTLGSARPDAQAAPALLALDEDDQTRLAALLSLAAAEFASAAPGRAEALAALASLLALQVQRLLPGSSRRPAASECPPQVGAGGARRGTQRPRDAQARLAQAFLAQVEMDFRAQPPLTDRASRLRVGVPHLSRACRAVLGRSALAVVHDRLLLEARRHLVYTSMTVQEIAYGLGFCDPAYFTRFFTERTRRTPTEYRKDVFTAAGTQDR